MKQGSIPESNHTANHHPEGPGQAANGAAPTSGRGPDGRFCKGNAGGPGNPYTRKVAAMRQEFMAAATKEDIAAIARALIAKAKEGDVAAAKVVLQYTVGRPAQTVDPDRLDEMEWQQWQREKVSGGMDVLTGTTATSMCAVARVAIPFGQEEKFAQAGREIQAKREQQSQEAARRVRAAARRAEREARQAARQTAAAEREETAPEKETAPVPAAPEKVETVEGNAGAMEGSPIEGQKVEEGGQPASGEGWRAAAVKMFGMMGITVGKRGETASRAANDPADGERR
jgi:hypothetical protein